MGKTTEKAVVSQKVGRSGVTLGLTGDTARPLSRHQETYREMAKLVVPKQRLLGSR